MAHDGCNCCFLFGAISSPFTSLTVQKVKISKKWIKRLEILSFYTSVPKIMIIWYTVLEIWHMAHVIVVFHFGLFFSSSPLTAVKNKIPKKWKKYLEISSFYTCVPKIMIRWYTVPEIWWATGGQTEKLTYRGGCPT